MSDTKDQIVEDFKSLDDERQQRLADEAARLLAEQRSE